MGEYIVVEKIQLADGEELMDLPRKIMAELTKQKAKLKRSLILTHIFGDHIVTRDLETRKRFRLELSRTDGGNIKLGKPEEVRTMFVPVKQKTSKAEAKKVDVKTGETQGHTHTATVDEGGNGKTSTNNGHKHLVRGWKVLPEKPGGHSHDLKKPEARSKSEDAVCKSEITSTLLSDDRDLLVMIRCTGPISAAASSEIEKAIRSYLDGADPEEVVKVEESFWKGTILPPY